MPGIAKGVISALADEEIIRSNALATVTTNFVVLRDSEGRSHMILSLGHISGLKKIKTSYPGLLVISAAFFLVAAAAFCSKEGYAADVPIALLGLAFVIAYVVSRRAAIGFVVGAAIVETETGGLSEAAAIIAAVQARLHTGSEREASSAILPLEATGS